MCEGFILVDSQKGYPKLTWNGSDTMKSVILIQDADLDSKEKTTLDRIPKQSFMSDTRQSTHIYGEENRLRGIF